MFLDKVGSQLTSTVLFEGYTIYSWMAYFIYSYECFFCKPQRGKRSIFQTIWYLWVCEPTLSRNKILTAWWTDLLLLSSLFFVVKLYGFFEIEVRIPMCNLFLHCIFVFEFFYFSISCYTFDYILCKIVVELQSSILRFADY